MSTAPEIVPVSTLLDPISEAAPAGTSLRYTPLWDEMVRARTAEADLPMGEWQRESKRADWKEVIRLGTTALREQTKDLQVAVWLAEAWIQTSPLDGLLASLHLFTGLHQYFAQTMFPVGQGGLNADSIEHRCNLLQAFNQRSAMLLRFAPLAAPADTALPSYTLADLDQLKFDEQVIRREARGDAADERALEARHEAHRNSDGQTPAAFYSSLSAAVRTAQADVRRLDGLMDELYGKENSGLGAIGDALAAIAQHLQPRVALLPSVKDVQPGTSPQENSAVGLTPAEIEYDGVANAQRNPLDPVEASRNGAGLQRRGPLNRIEAYDQIREAAEFLSRIEPHSPVPYLLRKAIRWGSMSLQELLPELLQRPEQLEDIRQLLHIQEQDSAYD